MIRISTQADMPSKTGGASPQILPAQIHQIQLAQAVNSRSIDLARVNTLFHGLLKEMGPARLNGDEKLGFLNSGLFAKKKLSCAEQSYILGKALILQGHSALLAAGEDGEHVVVIFKEGNHWYAADPRMNIPFKPIKGPELERMLGHFSLFKRSQKFDLTYFPQLPLYRPPQT